MTTNILIMFRIAGLLLLVSYGSAFAQQAGSNSVPAARRIIFTVVDQPPEFPGGTNALQKYLEDNLRYPEEAGKKFRDKAIFINFIITETGTIDSARVLKPVDKLVDTEVVRVIENMPAWIPGKQNGHIVAVRYTVPVRFPKK